MGLGGQTGSGNKGPCRGSLEYLSEKFVPIFKQWVYSKASEQGDDIISFAFRRSPNSNLWGWCKQKAWGQGLKLGGSNVQGSS